jgi:hypothetical protein
MMELRDRKCAEHYFEDVWARADAKTKACFNFLCGNHTHNLPNVLFVRTAMYHSRRKTILAQRCLPKPEPVNTRPARGHKTGLRKERREKVIKVRWRGRN